MRKALELGVSEDYEVTERKRQKNALREMVVREMREFKKTENAILHPDMFCSIYILEGADASAYGLLNLMLKSQYAPACIKGEVDLCIRTWATYQSDISDVNG